MNNISTLWNQMNYKPIFPYIYSKYIREYDMSKANINVLFTKGVIDAEQYNFLYSINKQYRETVIGNMIKDNYDIYKIIQSGIIEAKRLLFESNHITDIDVLSINNDAVTVIDKSLMFTEFGNYKFVLKNTYTLFFKLTAKFLDLEVYYNYNRISDTENINIKGINDNVLPLHQDGMLSLICNIAYMIQNDSIENTVSYLSNMYKEFINRKLPVDYYRAFDSDSQYTLYTKFSAYKVDYIDEKDIASVDINRNLSILRALHEIVSDIYFSKRR